MEHRHNLLPALSLFLFLVIVAALVMVLCRVFDYNPEYNPKCNL